MPDAASTYAGRVDWLFYFIFGISAFFFALIVGLMFLFLIRYHRLLLHMQFGRSPRTAKLSFTQPPAHTSPLSTAILGARSTG